MVALFILTRVLPSSNAAVTSGLKKKSESCKGTLVSTSHGSAKSPYFVSGFVLGLGVLILS